MFCLHSLAEVYPSPGPLSAELIEHSAVAGTRAETSTAERSRLTRQSRRSVKPRPSALRQPDLRMMASRTVWAWLADLSPSRSGMEWRGRETMPHNADSDPDVPLDGDLPNLSPKWAREVYPKLRS